MVTRRVAGEVILVPVTQKMDKEASLYTLDEVAAFLWDEINGERSGRDLMKLLQEAYDVGKEQSEQDVQTFLEQLESMDAVRATENKVCS